MKIHLLVYTLLAAFSSGYSQNSFTLGAKIGYGTSVFPMNATIFVDQAIAPARSGATISTGAIGRYMIADRFGIESGAWFNHYSFYREEYFRVKDTYWKSAAEFEMLNYQMPVLINYKIKPRRHPFGYFLVGLGTTLDWFSTSWVSARPSALRPQTLKNLTGSFRVGREKLRGKLEAGLEFQYSLKPFEFNDPVSSPSDGVVSSRLNMVSIVINYLFFKKERRNETV